MALYVPGEDANLVEVKRQAILGFSNDRQVLRDLLVSILDLIQHEERDNALALRVLRDVDRNVEINHAGQHPAHTVVGVAHQPPILDHRRGLFLVIILRMAVLRLAVLRIGALRIAPVAAERDGGAPAPGFSAVPRFNSDSFSPEEI